ncbi:hypothetical protein RhiJN_21671 [Ceratobasidium sp. AG-Ba]|nr:hypothetical protein RhiJN_21671 [Ceratobasidium sp. AG-Ba]
MRTRSQARPHVQREAEVDVASGESSAESPYGRQTDSPSPPPRRKRRALTVPSPKKAPVCVSRKKGRLSGVLLLPIEVFTEIASHLTPPDVIALSRSNRYFNKLLLSRSALHIWTAAIRNVPGLPPCPKDLCQPQYAALIYSKYCSMCGAGVVKPMDPYLNVRLCNSCRDSELLLVAEIPKQIVRLLTPQTLGLFGDPAFCLRSEKLKVEQKIQEIESELGEVPLAESTWVKERLRICAERVNFAHELAAFLEKLADARAKEIEELKSRRRDDIKERLTKLGWEEPDWKFPWTIARKWATMVENPKPLTDRIWLNMYPKMEPYLRANHQAQMKKFKDERRRRQERRMRALLIEVKRQNIWLKVDKKIIRGDTGDTNGAQSSALDSDGEVRSDDENSPGSIIMSSRRERQKVIIERPFPPMVDALALPGVARLLVDDPGALSLEEGFEDSRAEVEEALRDWSLKVEQDLVRIMHSSAESDDEPIESDSEIARLDLQFDLPSEYASFLENLSPNTRILLRADSVFRLANNKPSPLPLFYPEMFSVIQDRSRGYYGKGFEYYQQTHPRLGHPWDISDVESYPDGVTAAKLLLEQIGRPDATQFELQALGPRFVCGLCSDKWVRTWNEIVQHYAEALLNARLAKRHLDSTSSPIAYYDIHAPDPALRIKRKNKPLVVLHTHEEAKALSADQPSDMMLYQCNPCTTFGITFRASKTVIAKHVRTVHGIKGPRTEHRTRSNELLEHHYINTKVIKPRVSESSSGESSADEETWADRAREFGTAVYWSEWKSKVLAESDLE